MAADAKENVLLQGYAVTGVTLQTDQKIITQGYGPDQGPPPPPSTGYSDIVYAHGVTPTHANMSII